MVLTSESGNDATRSRFSLFAGLATSAAVDVAISPQLLGDDEEEGVGSFGDQAADDEEDDEFEDDEDELEDDDDDFEDDDFDDDEDDDFDDDDEDEDDDDEEE